MLITIESLKVNHDTTKPSPKEVGSWLSDTPLGDPSITQNQL